MRNSSIRKYTPVYERTTKEYYYPAWSAPMATRLAPRHVRGDVDLWNAIPTTKPKLCYTLLRIWLRRAGQLQLWPILSQKSLRKHKKNKSGKVKRVY